MPWTVNPDHGYLERFTTAGSIGALTNIDVDASTPPGTDPVMPDASDNIILTGAQVASGVVGANVIRSNSLAANSITMEVQQSGSAAAQDTTLNGVAHFNSAEFTVANGFVSLAGGGLAIDSVAVQTGTSPIVPTAAGLITLNGAVVAAGTNPVRSDGTGPNTLALEVQISQAIAATDATKIGLSNFDSAAFDVDANGFVQLNGGGIATTSFDVQANTGPGTDPVVPTAAGVVTVNGAAVANHSVVLETRSRAANAYNLEIQYATSAVATDATKSGVAHFNSTQFSVDANGFVALAGGGLAIDSIGTQTGTNPITPTAAGLVTINGAVVAAGTNPLRSNGTGANTMALEVQISQAIAATDATKIGLCNFNSTQFAVDANGFVTLAGGGLAIDSIGTQTGTNPITPTAAGLVTINGDVVAAGTNPIRSNGTGANTMAIEVQTSQALAAADATKIGLSNFDSSSFAVAATGFVTLSATGAGKTITGDAGGALSPTANNWNILGRSGSKTSGSGSTLTVNSPPFADQGVNTSVTLNSGSFATAAITLTTPVTAGLLDGDLLQFVATNGVLVVQLAATQVAHIGTLATTAAGTMTSTGTGDSLTLRYQASTNDWWATSVIGTWSMA